MKKLSKDQIKDFLKGHGKLTAEEYEEISVKNPKAKLDKRWGKTFVGLAIDASSSMMGDTLWVERNVLEHINEVEKIDPAIHSFLFTFQSVMDRFSVTSATVNRWEGPIKEARGNFVYRPSGSTPLWDGLGELIHAMSQHDNDRETFLVIIVTDGEENTSRQWNFFSIEALVKRLLKKGNWKFVALTPNAALSSGERFRQLGFEVGKLADFREALTSLTTGFLLKARNVRGQLPAFFEKE